MPTTVDCNTPSPVRITLARIPNKPLEAPRPGYRRAYLAYRLGLGHVTGYTWLSGPSGYRRPRRQSSFRKGVC